MGLFKKIFPDDSELLNDEDNSVLPGYQSPDEPDDATRPRPQFILAKPERREELLTIADSLIDRKTVILNLEYVPNETKRFVDFLSGVAYALNGQVKKVALHTFLIIPGGLDISGDIFDDIEGELNF